jgi:hypothetical protein
MVAHGRCPPGERLSKVGAIVAHLVHTGVHIGQRFRGVGGCDAPASIWGSQTSPDHSQLPRRLTEHVGCTTQSVSRQPGTVSRPSPTHDSTMRDAFGDVGTNPRELEWGPPAFVSRDTERPKHGRLPIRLWLFQNSFRNCSEHFNMVFRTVLETVLRQPKPGR